MLQILSFRIGFSREESAVSRDCGQRDVFGELMEGLAAMKAHREGKLTLRSYKIDPTPLPRLIRS